MEIPLVDLKSQYKTIKKDIDAAIFEVIEKSQFIDGPLLKRFESNFAAFCGAKYCVGTSNGTSSIYCALKAIGLKPGDEIITAANTFIATTEAISLAGGKFKLVDIDKRSYNMDIASLKNTISNKTKAIIPIHMYGHPCDLEPIYEIAKEKDLFVIEDAAQAHGARYRGKRIGSLGGVVSFSFFPAKILGCYGDGGAIVTNDKELSEKIRLEVDHGRHSKYEHIKEGFNFRLDTLQANILNAKLKYLEEWIKKRRQNAQIYNENLSDFVTVPYEEEYAEHSYYMYVIRVKMRERLVKFLKERGIGTGIHYPIPLHKQEAYRNIPTGSFPVTDEISSQILSIPNYPELSVEQQEYIYKSIKEFYNSV
ncbi:MAG: DegT/DnrJ/EryC1/StrS family aminotransferase [Candidatus Woesearchaeota archaeon]